jgi:hypothetical protein
MNNFLWRNKKMYKIASEVFFDALSHIFNLDEISRVNLYWIDISPSDKSIVNSELQLEQVSYTHETGKVEELLFNNDQCYTTDRDVENQKFYDALAEYIFGKDEKGKFSNIYIQYSSQLDKNENNKDRILICGNTINGKLILI